MPFTDAQVNPPRPPDPKPTADDVLGFLRAKEDDKGNLLWWTSEEIAVHYCPGIIAAATKVVEKSDSLLGGLTVAALGIYLSDLPGVRERETKQLTAANTRVKEHLASHAEAGRVNVKEYAGRTIYQAKRQ